jgi:alkylation response protein AidB-like acyl-CoA dehydrogenase
MAAYDEYYKMLEPKFKFPQCFCSEEEIAMAEVTRKWVNKEVMPLRHDLEGGWHKDEELAHKTIWRLYGKMHRDLQIQKSNYPIKYGGLEQPPLSRIMLAEELSRGDCAFGTIVGKIHWCVVFMLMAQRDDLLEEFAPMITGEKVYTPCICITEPAGGANTEDTALKFKAVRTIATLDGDEYVINGHKIWPGDSGPPEFFEKFEGLDGHMGYFIVATTDPAKGEDGIGIYYAPPDAKGLVFSEPFEKMGQTYTDINREIWFDELRIPKKYRIDTKPGEAAKIIHAAMVGFGKLTSSARLTGVASSALEIVLDFTKHREIVGKPARERSIISAQIGELFARLDAVRSYYMATAWMTSHPEIYGPPWSKEMGAKYASCRLVAADMCNFVINRGMDLMGAYGYSYEFHIEKLMRDFKISQLWLGGYGRDRMDICQGLYGPFEWGGQKEWEKKQKVGKKGETKRITSA